MRAGIQIASNHPLSVLKNKTTQTVVLVAFVIGFLLGYVSFIVGVMVSFHSLRCLIQCVRYRRTFLNQLKWHAVNAKKKSSNVRAIVTCKEQLVDPITGECKYKMVLEYQIDSTQQLIIKSDEYPIAACEVYRDCPQEGFAIPIHAEQAIPTEFYQDRIQDLQLWAQWVDPIISIVGICLYLFMAYLYAQLVTLTEDGFYCIMGMALGSMVLMTPYILLDVRVRHEQRLESLNNNPLALVTEFEKIRSLWYSLGPTMSQKLRPLLFAAGVLSMAVFAGIGIIPGCWAVWSLTKWTDAKITSQRESLLQLFGRAKKVSGKMVDCFLPQFGQTQKHSVTIQYTAPSGEKVEKRIQHDHLLRDYLRHQKQSSNAINPKAVPVELLVLLDHPGSGYPEKDIM